MSETATPSPGRLAAPRPKLKDLARRSMRIADKASEYLDEAGIEELKKRMAKMKHKDFINAMNFMERIALARQHVAKAAGLSKFSNGSAAPQTIVNVNVRGDLPFEERIKLIQAEVSGVPQIVPGVLPEPGRLEVAPDPVKPPLTGESPASDPEVSPPPQSPPAALLGSQDTRSLEDRLRDL